MLTQYTQRILEEVDHSNPRARQEAISCLKTNAAEAKDPQAAVELNAIGGALSMFYTNAERGYRPIVVLADGRRSYAVEDLDPAAMSALRDAADTVRSGWMKAQLADIVWLQDHDYRFGEMAAREYLGQFQAAFDPEHWPGCYQAVERAMDIALTLGEKSAVFRQIYQAIRQKLLELNGEDPLFLSLKLISLLEKHADAEDLPLYLELAEKIFKRNLRQKTERTNLVELAFSVQEQLLKRLRRSDQLPPVQAALAAYYEDLAEQLQTEGPNGVYRATDCLQKAHRLYRTLSEKTKTLEIRKRIEALQRISRQNMGSIPIEFDATGIHSAVEKLFAGLTVQESIVQFGRLARIYTVEAVQKQVLDEQKQFQLSALFSRRIVDQHGRTIEKLAPLDQEHPTADPDNLRKHMVMETAQMRIGESIALRNAFPYLKNAGDVPPEALDFLVRNNGLIPEGRAEIIKTGLHMGLFGDLYAAMHILLPQTEHIIRNLVTLCGDTVTYLKDDGTEEWKPLSQLLRSEKLLDCYSEDIIFTLQSILDEKAGANLRNLNAHGLLEPAEGRSGTALCFLCLLIRLLSMYSPEALATTAALSEKQKNL